MTAVVEWPGRYVEELAARVKRRRMNCGLSLREASRECGVSFSVIARLERGEASSVTPRVHAALRQWLRSGDLRLRSEAKIVEAAGGMAAAILYWELAVTDEDKAEAELGLQRSLTVYTDAISEAPSLTPISGKATPLREVSR